MNKSDLIAALAKEADLPHRKAEEIVNLVFETMSKALIEGNRIEIRGFGSFMVKEYRGYTGRNPKTGEQILVTDKRLPFFKTGKELKEKVDAATKAMK
ncbi:MAG: HU family DNA-binding protein [Desulfomonilaceae bacterium]